MSRYEHISDKPRFPLKIQHRESLFIPIEQPTFAMEAGLTDHVWEIDELIAPLSKSPGPQSQKRHAPSPPHGVRYALGASAARRDNNQRLIFVGQR
jgi:hypothetical protein